MFKTFHCGTKKLTSRLASYCSELEVLTQSQIPRRAVLKVITLEMLFLLLVTVSGLLSVICISFKEPVTTFSFSLLAACRPNREGALSPPRLILCVFLCRWDRLRRSRQGPGSQVPGRGGDLQPRRGLLERGPTYAKPLALTSNQFYQCRRRGREAVRVRRIPRSRYRRRFRVL